MPKAQDAANWTNPPLLKRPAGASGPLVSTLAGKRDGSRPVDEPDPEPTPGGTTLFEDDLSAQSALSPEYGELFAEDGAAVPDGWDYIRNVPPSWGQSAGLDAVRISDEPEWQRDGSTKSVVFRRFIQDNAWGGDGILGRHLLPGYDEIYVRFYIKFQAGWQNTGQSKLFRVYVWDGAKANVFKNSVAGFLWGTEFNSFGMRNKLSLYSQPRLWGDQSPEPVWTRAPQSGSDTSGNYTADSFDLDGDGTVDNDPVLINQLTGEPFIESDGGTFPIEAIFGDAWHKMEFYAKMNSAPGVGDGQFRMWMDDSEIYRGTQMAWMQATASPGLKFNDFRLGGNDIFEVYEDGTPVDDSVDAYSEQYAMHDILVMNGLPDSKEPI